MDREPSVVCVFRSTLRHRSDEQYEKWSAEMDTLVREVPGYLRHFSFRGSAAREGVTISYFDSMQSLDEWRTAARHRQAQQYGRDSFYDEYEIEVATIVREYRWSRTSAESPTS